MKFYLSSIAFVLNFVHLVIGADSTLKPTANSTIEPHSDNIGNVTKILYIYIYFFRNMLTDFIL